jgi:hypothetical protein
LAWRYLFKIKEFKGETYLDGEGGNNTLILIPEN